MNSLIQIVDGNDQPIGVATMQEAWSKGLIHRIVQIVVESPGKKILLQKRSQKVDLYPGRWDLSAAGHVDAGEDYLTAAKREVNEELGLVLDNLEELGSRRGSKIVDGKKLNRFYKAYKVTIEEDTKLTPQVSEVSELRWFTKSELVSLFAQPDSKYTDSLRRIIKEYYL